MYADDASLYLRGASLAQLNETINKDLNLRSISELNENELKLVTFKSLNDLAPNCLEQFQIRNSQESYRPLRNTDRDLKLPMKKTDNGQKGYSFR